jgi:DNA invertase Pin-like site-specific DNA recombinase
LKHAVIYCRVSSKKQVTEGHGLSSQEATCRQYAERNGYTVRRVFADDYSGGGDFWARPGLRDLLGFLEEQADEHAVIFDDIKRFARDTIFHLKLRQELAARNAVPLCPTFRFDDTPEGEFVETVIAATAELERKQNRRQVIRRMQARLEAGYWIFCPPFGYRNVRQDGNKITVPDPHQSEAARSALEGYATGKLRTQAEVVGLLRSRGCERPQSQNGTFSKQSIQRFLRSEFYAGWCVCKKWGIRVRGRHEPLISEATHRRILERLEPSVRPLTRTNARPDFPLRGFVVCSSCRRRLTAGWTQGSHAKFPYYRCQTRRCAGSLPKERVERQFVNRLREAAPSEHALKLFEEVLSATFSSRQVTGERERESRLRRLAEIDRETDNLLSALSRAQDSAAMTVFERRIGTLQKERERLEEPPAGSEISLEPLLQEGRSILWSPDQHWQNADLKDRRIVQSLVFEQPIWYSEDSGFCTTRFSLLYRLLGSSEGTESNVVDMVQSSFHEILQEIKRWEAVLADV